MTPGWMTPQPMYRLRCSRYNNFTLRVTRCCGEFEVEVAFLTVGDYCWRAEFGALACVVDEVSLA